MSTTTKEHELTEPKQVINHDSLVGQPIERVEDARLLMGLGKFVDDIPCPDGLHLALLRSDLPHAEILNIDISKAQNCPGVFGVYLWTDIQDLIKPAVATSRMAGYQSTPIYPLANGQVHFVGEPVVAVLAENRYQAEDAIECIEIKYLPKPFESDAIKAMRSEAPILHTGLSSNILVERTFSKGEVNTIFEDAPFKVKANLRFHRRTAAPLENRCYLAMLDLGRDALTLYSSTQVPGIIRDALCELLCLSGHQLHVIAPDVGGGFGAKTSMYQEEALVCALARKTKRSVKWTGDRLEDLLSTSQAFDETIEAELALDLEGHILALRAEVVGDVGAYSIYPWTAGIEPVQVISFMPGPYKVPAYHGHVSVVSTPKAPTGPYRGVGRPASTFAMERLIDLAAHALNIDPAEIRRRNLVKPHEFPYRSVVGLVWDKSGFSECLDAALEKFEYQAARQLQQQARAEGRWVGIGLASYAELSGIGSKISASPGMPINTGTDTCQIQLDSTGYISASFGCASHGQGHETTLSQILADELGARLSDIRVHTGNTEKVPHGTGSYASRTAVISGGAAILAARELRARILRMAAYLLKSDLAVLQIQGSVILSLANSETLSFSELAKAVYAQMGRIPADMREELCLSKTYDPVNGTTTSATHVVQVEIDPRTMAVQVQRYVIAEDCGKIINPLIVTGQTRGALAQGIGAALSEEVVYDNNGQLLTATLADYLLPSATEVPQLELIHIPSISINNVGGFRGMGEGGTIGAPAAIANAVSDALAPKGLNVTELPITPQRIFQMVQQSIQTKSENQK